MTSKGRNFPDDRTSAKRRKSLTDGDIKELQLAASPAADDLLVWRAR